MRKHIDTINNEIFAPIVAIIQDLPWHHPVLLVKRVYTHFASDSLYRNSIYLMLSTAIMAFFGFFFWMISTRLYASEHVGIATTLISIVGLISSFSLLGFNSGIVRYLPTSERKNQKINTSFALVAIASLSMGLIFLIFINIFSPKLLFIRENIFYAIFFIIVIVISSLNTISENVFIAYRASGYLLVKNTVFSIVKLALPVFLVSLGAYGIFASVGISIVVAFMFGLIILIIKFSYLFRPTISREVVKRMTKFSLGNYIAVFIGGLPAMILPILILNNLGAKFSAYFYMDMMIANFLFIIPLATSQSLFAEGSYIETELKIHLKKAVMIIFMLLTPAIIITLLFGKYILLAFGLDYSNEGFEFLQLLSVSCIFVSINSVIGTTFLVKHRLKELIFINIINAVLILGLSYFLISEELLGIGFAWLISQATISICYLYLWFKTSN